MPKKPLARYEDTYCIDVADMLEYYKESDPEKYMELLCEDSKTLESYMYDVYIPDLQEIDWDSFCYILGERLIACNKDLYFKVIASDIGWLHRSGFKYMSLTYMDHYDGSAETSVGKDFMSQMYPRGFEGSVEIYCCHGHGTEFIVKNHDNPVRGDRYRVTRCAQSTYEDNT